MRLLDHLLDTSPDRLSIEYFPMKSFPNIDLSFADTDPTVQKSSPKDRKSNKQTTSFQNPGRVNENITGNTVFLQYRNKFICEPCQFETSKCFLFWRPFTQRSTFWYLSINNVLPYYFFCKFQDNIHNCKCHINSERHKKKLKTILLSNKLLFGYHNRGNDFVFIKHFVFHENKFLKENSKRSLIQKRNQG